MMATIQGVYLALFGRPADPAGLSFFNGVTANGANLAGIADLAKQPEYLTRFAGKTQTEIVQTIYQSLFGRDGDPAGVAFFVGELNSGRQTINSIAINILDGAQGTDLTLANKKLAASALFTAAIDTDAEKAAYNGTTINVGVDFLKAITLTSTEVTKADADAAVLLLGGGTGGPSLALTTADDAFVGTDGADAYTAVTSSLSEQNTLNSGDNIDGRGGSDSITISSGTAPFPFQTPTLTSIENMTVKSHIQLDLKNVTGLQKVFNEGGVEQSMKNVSSQLFVFGDKSSGDAFFSMKTGQATLNLMLNGSSTVDADINQLKTGTATLINIESIGPQGSIPTGGSSTSVNSILYVGENASGATFKITGDASTSIAGGFQNTVIVDGSGHTGDLYVNASNGNDQLKGGSGTNTFNGLDGFDIIDLSKSTGNIDTVKLTTAKTFADRDLVIGFQAGPGGDKIELRNSDTTHSNTGNASLGELALPAAGALNVSAFDVFEITTQINQPLSTADAASNLFQQVQYNLTSDLGTKAYFVAYGTSNTAALFYFENTSTTTISDGDVQLVGVFSNVSLGAFDASNFNFV